jgi:hypothetical protein
MLHCEYISKGMKINPYAPVSVKPLACFSTATIFISYIFKFNCSNVKHTSMPVQTGFGANFNS